MVKVQFGLAIAAVVCVLASQGHAASQYSVLDLGTVSSAGTGETTTSVFTGQALNSKGQVAGRGNTPYVAFVSAPNSATLTNLGNLGGGGTNSGYAINDSGQAVGSSSSPTGTHAFRTVMNGLIVPATTSSPGSDLGTLGGATSVARGINAKGQVVGYSLPSTSTTIVDAFRTTATGTLADGTATDLGNFGGTSGTQAWAINTSGQTAGFGYITGNAGTVAFRTTSSGLATDSGANLQSFGGTSTNAYDINVNGQVVGNSNLAGDTSAHAYRTSNTGNLTSDGSTAGVFNDDLGVLPGYTNSQAYGINDAGQVVGYCSAGNSNDPFFADTTGPMVDLNSLITGAPGVILTQAWSINNSGQIAANGTAVNGQTHAFLLTPVPEPTSLMVVGAALTLLGRRRRRTVPSMAS